MSHDLETRGSSRFQTVPLTECDCALRGKASALIQQRTMNPTFVVFLLRVDFPGHVW